MHSKHMAWRSVHKAHALTLRLLPISHIHAVRIFGRDYVQYSIYCCTDSSSGQIHTTRCVLSSIYAASTHHSTAGLTIGQSHT